MDTRYILDRRLALWRRGRVARLRAYYEAHPEFIVEDGEMIKACEPLDYRVELALSETILVDVLRSSPACVLDRASLATECTRRSMNVNTFSINLSYSPVVLHLGTDVWSLRGVRVDPAAVEAVREANALRQKERRVLDHGCMASPVFSGRGALTRGRHTDRRI
jgi:hypothetical protein